MDLMPELRSALHAPSDSSWSKVRWLLERWIGEFGVDRMRDVAIPYCSEHLARWPDEIARPAPQDWVTRLKRGEPVPALALATELLVYPSPERSEQERLQRLERVLDAPGARGVQALTIDSYVLDEAPPTFLAKYIARATRLTRLEVTDANLSARGLTAMLENANLTNLRRLGLAGNQIGHTGTGWLANREDLRGLIRLDVRRNHLTRRALQKLAPHGELASLERIDYAEQNSYASTWKHAVIRSPHVTKELKRWMRSQ